MSAASVIVTGALVALLLVGLGLLAASCLLLIRDAHGGWGR